MVNLRKRRFPQILRFAVHLGSLLPFILLAGDALTGGLSANPYQEAEQRTGETALILLLLSLACTPLSFMFGFSQAVRHRRALGLYAFFYASLHLIIFAALDYGLDVNLIIEAIQQNRYILVGLVAFLFLLVLALTSFRWWVKRLGKNWSRLHRSVYLAGGLVILHYAWVVKGDFLSLSGDVLEPLLYGTLLALLLVVRVPPLRRRITQLRRRLQDRPVQLFSTGNRTLSSSKGQE